MNRHVLRSILGIVALTAIGAANAGVVLLGTSPTGPSLNIGDIGLIPLTYQASGASFSDDFYFSLASSSKLDSDVTNIALVGFGFSSLGAELIDTSNHDDVVGSGLNFTASSLAAGNYELQVSGAPLSPLGGIFSGAIHVSAVPIPAAAWLLLSGLAGLGAIARRRKSEV